MTPAEVSALVAAALGVEVHSATPVGGGCTADAHRVELADGGGPVFAKPSGGLPAGALEVEAEGLAWLRQAGALPLPAVRAVNDVVLVLEWIEPGGPTPPGGDAPGTDERLGRGLAALHRAGAESFGWHRDGTIGSIAQRNTPPDDDWCTFWATRRLAPLAQVAHDRGALDDRVPALVDSVIGRLDRLAGPPEPPARVHGDLWSGNILVDRRGEPWLVDPSSYGGHREVDLAMLHLFGAPRPAVVAAYEEVWPLAEGWRERMRLWQLEPLLAHAVMFGGTYGASVRAALDSLV